VHSIIKLLTLNIKTMKREDLKLGEYYVYDKRQVLIFKGIKVNTKVLDLETKSFTTQNYSYNLDDIRHATPEEKHWLDVCINKDTFVPREIAMVTFKSKEIDFIYGEWYKSNHNNGGRWFYLKALRSMTGVGKRVEGEGISSAGYYNRDTYWNLEDAINQALKLGPMTDLTEIQEFLPAGHIDKIDKIVKNTSNRVILCTTKDEWDDLCDSKIAQSSKVQKNWFYSSPKYMYIDEGLHGEGLPSSDYYVYTYSEFKKKYDTPSAEAKTILLQDVKADQYYYAEYEEERCRAHGTYMSKERAKELGIKEVTIPHQSVFLKDDYIVTLQEVSSSFPKNHIFKQRETTDYLRVYKDIRGEANGNTIAKFTKTSLWRYATKQEIMEYDIQDRPVDVTRIGMANLLTYEPNPVDYVIPSNAKKWAVKRTTENCVELNAWANSRDTSIIGHSKDTGWIHSISYGFMGHSGDGHYYSDKIKHPDHIEISFEQWKMDHLNAPKINIEPIKTNTMDLDKWYIELEFIDPNRDIIINYLNKKYNRCMTGSGGFYFVENGRFKCESKAPKDYYRISTEQFKRDIMKDKVTYNHVPKYVKCISYAQKHNGEIFCTDDPPPLTLIRDGSTWHQRLINMNRLNDGSFVPATREEYEAFITKNNKVVLPSYKDKSLGEMCDLCNQMFPIGSVVDFSNNGSDIYTIKEKLYIGSNSYVSYVGLPIVYRQNEDTLRCSLVSKPVKTIEDLPKKAKMSDVSTLTKHQEPIIVNRQKTKRSKLVIINK
jgi:hypothetical protein